MADTILDRLPVADLPSRYEIDRSTFYDRIAPLNLTFERGEKGRKFANAEQIELLDNLHSAVKAGRTAEFLKSLGVSDGQEFESDRQDGRHTAIQPMGMFHAFQVFHEAIAQLQRCARDVTPFFAPNFPQYLPHPVLQHAAAQGWRLKTSQVRNLIGVSPRGNCFSYLGFEFVRNGKCGREAQWSVRIEQSAGESSEHEQTRHAVGN